ncbi:MAG: amidase [Opitutae bacterium]|nr:amidase [Opitutae bacterium]
MASDLSALLGTILSSLAHARRAADLETAKIAELYKEHPLLEGMSLPRIRVPEMVIDLPIVIDSDDPGTPNELTEPADIHKGITAAFADATGREKVEIPQQARDQFAAELRTELGKVQTSAATIGATREAVVRAVDSAFARTIPQGVLRGMQRPEIAAVVTAVRARAADIALKKIGRPPSIRASFDTNSVKDRAGAANVVRLKITLREEGLEWSAGTSAGGTPTSKLTPE